MNIYIYFFFLKTDSLPPPNPHFEEEVQKRLLDLEEKAIDRRLQELKANFSECTACHFCQILYRDTQIKQHLEKCVKRIVKCFICGTGMRFDLLRDHLPPCRLAKRIKKRKEKSKDKKNKNKETTEKKKKPKKGEKKTDKKKTEKKKRPKKGEKKTDKKKKRNRKGVQFKLQKHGAIKYRIIKKLCIFDRTLPSPFIKFPEWIKQMIIGNEFGSGPRPNPHTHCVLVTKKKMSFEELKCKIKEESGLTFNDVQSCKNIRHDIQYVGKEDFRPIIFNFDSDSMHVNVKAYIHAQKYSKLTPASYPYCSLPMWQKKDFQEKYNYHRHWENVSDAMRRCPEFGLRPWQRQVDNYVKHKTQDDRQIMWILDPKGNNGKSYLSKYLRLYWGAFAINGDSLTTKDFAFAYDGQRVVVIDFPRCTDSNSINYSILEALKNGSIFSAKYESKVLDFDTAMVICMSNVEPNYLKLSPDRWGTMFTIEGEKEEAKLKRFIPDLPSYSPLNFVQGSRNLE